MQFDCSTLTTHHCFNTMNRLLTPLLFGLSLLLLAPGIALAQSGTITGQIIDGDTAESLPGASVLVVGEGIGAATDADGQYTIEGVPPGDWRTARRL